MAGNCGGDLLANALIPSLVGDKDFDIPDNQPTPLTNDMLTTQEVGGTGTFDILMTTVRNHLKDEYDQNRITGDQYVKAYIELTGAAMQSAVQFLVQRDQTYWQTILIRQQTMNAEVEYALGKMKVASEDATYCNLLVQKTLLQEQAEAARAQTLDTRTDGQTVTGSIGKQKDLYNQQITSYQRDAEVKAGKLFTDAWTVQKTIDEGLLAPDGFTNDSIDEVLKVIKENNGFD